MSEVETLETTKRESTGTAATNRLRKAGQVPAVLYGHGEANEHLAIPAKQVQAMLRHHSKTVALKGASDATALVNEIQFDPLGIEVLHLDLIRVNLKEQVEVTVPVHTLGEAEGVRSGGILLENLHEIDVTCPAGAIPESIDVDVSGLKLGGSMTAGDLPLPEGVALVTDADQVVLHVEEPRGSVEAAPAEGSSEPEVISKGGGDSEEEA